MNQVFVEDTEEIFNATKVQYVVVYNAVVEVLSTSVETIFSVVIKSNKRKFFLRRYLQSGD